MAMVKSLPAGTEVFCPNCRVKISTAKKLVTTTDALPLRAFKFEPGLEHGPGDKPICKACGAPYTRSHSTLGPQIHTRHGWRPAS